MTEILNPSHRAKPRAPFVQIAVGSDSKFVDRIYALDRDGIVWSIVPAEDDCWLPVSKKRKSRVVGAPEAK